MNQLRLDPLVLVPHHKHSVDRTRRASWRKCSGVNPNSSLIRTMRIGDHCLGQVIREGCGWHQKMHAIGVFPLPTDLHLLDIYVHMTIKKNEDNQTK